MQSDSPFFGRLLNSSLGRYGLALLAAGVSLLACFGLRPFLGDQLSLPTPLVAVAFAAWFCGLGPAVLSMLVCLLGMRFWFIPPVHGFRIPDPAYSVLMLAFVGAAFLLMAMGETRRRHNLRLLQAQGELEARVADRTAKLDTANRSLRDLSARLLQLQDEERRRIARELHDSVGQTLAALSMNLAVVRKGIEDLSKCASTLADSDALIQDMNTEVRTISHLLHPPLLDEAGLASAIRWFTDGFAERSKIEVDLVIPEDFGRLTREMETAVFRTVQECLTNIHRHAESATARVRITRSVHEVGVEVTDRGKGIPAEKQLALDSTGTPGVGIRGMRERIRQLGGSVDINSQGEGSGTTVTVRLPIAATTTTAAA
ncbi:MAG TPA: sensor histidine kinase [Terriglobales bacterium]|jgi:signal transduction histidine kinase